MTASLNALERVMPDHRRNKRLNTATFNAKAKKRRAKAKHDAAAKKRHR